MPTQTKPFSVSLETCTDEGILTFDGDVTAHSANDVVAGLEQLFAYYHYPQVTIRINSNGGALMGLQHMLGAVARWRGEGKVIRTEAGLNAASAAALLLSLGDVGERRMQAHTVLLYHHLRVAGRGGVDITAGTADRLSGLLQSKDREMVLRLVRHLCGGNELAMVAQGLARCELLRQRHAEVIEALGLPAERQAPRWLRQVEGVYQKCQREDAIKGYASHLYRRIGQEQLMDAREAYALMLVDGVVGVADLPAQAKVQAPAQRLDLVV